MGSTEEPAKMEEDSTKEETKTDVAETTEATKPEDETPAKESETSKETTADETATAVEEKETDAKEEVVSTSDSVNDEVAKEVAATDESKTEAKADGEEKEETTKEDEQAQTENDSESDSSSVEEEEDKSIGNNNWDNSYSNELKKMYSNVDADTRAVAEEMIRAAQGGNKPKTQDETESSSQRTPTAIAPKPDPKPAAPETEGTKSSTVINKGKEPSALELALKQQGITQSDQLRSTQFPFRLHNMLDDAERSGHAHIVSWCPGGDSFKIHKPAKLINVLQKYFRQSKFKSFLRQLQGYNFKRITRGKDQGVVSHPLFLRGRRSVSTLMRRKRVGPKPDTDHASKIAATASETLILPKKSSVGNDGVAKQNSNPRVLAQARHAIPLATPSAIHSAPGFLAKPASQQPQAGGIMNPNPQDVLCVDYPNGHQVQQFQGNRKLASIVQKITGHYTSANESVRTMIVNEISSRIQNSGSRFLKLSKDGLSWMECNREEMFRKVISCFEQEIGPKEKSHIDLTGDSDTSTSGSATIDKALPGMHGVGAAAEAGRRLPPQNQDVVLRGGPGSEREGNTYLKTMIQANVGQQLDSFEMKRIKCRAILERMKRRGSRFFLKLKETDTDDEMYILSDAEAQDVIYTAFCAEEKKIQSLLMENSTASSILRAKALAGLDGNHPGLSGLGGASQFAASRAAALQSDAALLNQLKANNDISLLASQNSLKRPLPGHAQLAHENIIEKRLRAETDEHIKLLIERERQRRDPYGATALAGRLPFNARSAVLDSTIPLSTAFGAAGTASSSIDQYLKERRADELLLKHAAASRAPFAAGPTPASLAADLPKSNNHFVEFLKKKYVKSAQERAW